ncbi:MAG: UvrD-helicase domain-containing protein [Dokdonella sp.]|nr:UvrD-helicase domain-containing protein [Dokdonella sp.]
MEFRIADTFTESLARLTSDEQKATKTTAFDLQLNPAHPGMSFHKLERAKDRNFWSLRVNADIRLIVHRTASSLLLCYVDHHDKAYAWAERRRLEVHPSTGAAQLIEIRHRVEEVAVRRYIEIEQSKLSAKLKVLPFADIADEELLGYGVPQEWLADVHTADEDALLDLATHLPAEAAEALLELATGGRPQKPVAPVPGADPFAHPDAQRRFRTVRGIEELERALTWPWDRWMVFLHPAQRQLVEQKYNGSARVSGSAGTGKTIVALHRAVHLAHTNPDARVLLATFSETLANALRGLLKRLLTGQPRLGERIDVHTLDDLAVRLYEPVFGRARVASRDDLRAELSEAATQTGSGMFSDALLLGEWEEVADAWQLESWEAYRAARRLGRKTRLPEARRAALWSVFERVRVKLAARGLMTLPGVYAKVETELATRKHPPFDFAVIDEAQDLNVAQLRFLTALGRHHVDALFFAGDQGQRIFQTPFSWKALGIDVRGRSRTLRINYRTSHQIRMQADHLLGPEVSDADGNVEERRGTVSMFNGPAPEVCVFDTQLAEAEAVAAWLKRCRGEGTAFREIGIFVRCEAELNRALQAVHISGQPFKRLDGSIDDETDRVSIGTMHLAKGLEFRAVAVMACDDDVIPSQERTEDAADDADLQEIYDTERHLLYVACTRARDRLLVTGVSPESEFISDLKQR